MPARQRFLRGTRRRDRHAAGLALLLALITAAGCGVAPRSLKSESRLRVEADPAEPARIRVWLEGRAAAELRRFLGERAARERVEAVFYLALARDGTPAAAQTPILANLRWEKEIALLEPAILLTPGHRYQAVFDGPRVSPELPRLSDTYTVLQVASRSTARIVAISPTGDLLPANLLKFYVHFSEPMAEGKVFSHARLLDARGRPVEQAFREVELWAEEHRRLTLWINPGRTKRALGLSESLGPVLQPGRRYTLEILPGLPDQRGRPLARGSRHRFRTTQPDGAQPNIDGWRITTPPPGARRPLAVGFGDRLDRILAGRLIEVLDSRGRAVEGTASVADDGASWSFRPAHPWRSGEYTLVAGDELEDLAGNSLARPFESAGPARRPQAEGDRFRRAFTISP